MTWAATFRGLLHREPIIVWSFMIGGVGLSLPLVVPPLREAVGIGRPSPPPPPTAAALIERARQ
jgi:hypothetical protein